MKVSLGILAHNERERIGRTIRSLLAQTLFTDPPAGLEAAEVVCVPNGCSDDTGGEASRTFDEVRKMWRGVPLETRVEPVERAGKCNAWNQFVHRFSDGAAEVLFLVDGDIWFEDPGCTGAMIRALSSNPGAWVAVDTPVKHIAGKNGKSVVDRASLALSTLTQAGAPAIAGSLYCARAAMLRRLWLPDGLLVDDGYVRAMMLTEFFTKAESLERIVRAPGAWHVFEAYSGVRSVFKHSKRLAVGTAVNCMLFEHLWENRNGEDAGGYVQRRLDADPSWLRTFVKDEVGKRGWWAVGRGELFRRLTNLKAVPWAKRALLAPLGLAGLAFDAAVMVAANRDLKKGRLKW